MVKVNFSPSPAGLSQVSVARPTSTSVTKIGGAWVEEEARCSAERFASSAVAIEAFFEETQGALGALGAMRSRERGW